MCEVKVYVTCCPITYSHITCQELCQGESQSSLYYKSEHHIKDLVSQGYSLTICEFHTLLVTKFTVKSRIATRSFKTACDNIVIEDSYHSFRTYNLPQMLTAKLC